MDKFDENPVIDAAVVRGLRLLAGRQRGDVVPWAAIEEAAGFGRYTRHWSAFFKRLRRDYLRTTGVCLWPVTGVGMELLTTQGQLTERSEKRRRKALRQMRRDVRELTAIPDKDLSDRQKVLRAAQVAAGREGARQVNRQLRTVDLPRQADRVRPAPSGADGPEVQGGVSPAIPVSVRVAFVLQLLLLPPSPLPPANPWRVPRGRGRLSWSAPPRRFEPTPPQQAPRRVVRAARALPRRRGRGRGPRNGRRAGRRNVPVVFF